jgi:ribonuclease G
MNKELYVSSTPHETKVALMEDDQLAEVFFERENEYTLAGSIYKGRVTRVLPGMQSAFVDIGLERDAFLYVSDFLELSGDEEEDEEFGEIPAPRGAIDLSNTQPAPEFHAAEAQPATTIPDSEDDSDLESIFEEEAPAATGDQLESASAGDGEDSDGARRWRGRRRRRGGRRGRGPEQESAESKPTAAPTPVEPVEQPAPRVESRPRPSYGPPAGYTPIILPGESISKYRNLPQSAVEPQALSADNIAAIASEDVATSATVETEVQVVEEIQEESAHLDQGYSVAEAKQSEAPSAVESEQVQPAAVSEEEQPSRPKRRWGNWRRKAANAEVAAPVEQEQAQTIPQAEEHPISEPQTSGPSEVAVDEDTQLGHKSEAALAKNSLHQQEKTSHHDAVQSVAAEAERGSEGQPEAEQPTEHEVDTPAGNYELPSPEQHAAPSIAPAGHTLEHEVLEDEEMEFQPVPDDVTAMREVAGDEELVLEEETLDADNGYSERWVPKIADVDEDEVVAAEMRGEKIYPAEEEEEAVEENGEKEEVNDHAELRASAPTAGYQQRNAQRPGYGRRDFRDRGRQGGSRRNMRSRPNNNRNQPLITDLLKEGQEVLIQIAKEPIGKKGARITSHIALPGRFLVYMPTVNHVGVSRKIASDEERQRLKRIVTSERENGLGGFIVRTAAVNIKEEDLRADIRFLKHLWAEIKTRTENSKSPALIYHDLNLVERVLRDQVNADFSQIWVDTEDEYERVVRFANRFQPSLVRRIKLYTKDTPLYEQFGIQDEINRSLKSKVWLKSGGHIVINQTEALVAIDVNTGKFVGKTQRLEDTIVKVNVDAIKEIVRQVRLRDLGGIIVIDFIDMDERKNRQKVMMALEEALRNDRAPSKVLQFNDFGLVAITRKRVKQSLERTLGESCPYCTGAGFVKSVPTVCNELYIEMRKMTKVHDKDDITVRVHPEVAKALKANNGKLITELEDLTSKTVLVKSDPALHQEMFDIH